MIPDLYAKALQGYDVVFVNRITRFCASKFDSKTPDGGEWGVHEDKLWTEFSTRLGALTQFLEQMEMRKAAAELRAIWVAGQPRARRWGSRRRSSSSAA